MTVTEKLANIFTTEFVNENSHLGDMDSIYEKVAERAPEITKEELAEFQ